MAAHKKEGVTNHTLSFKTISTNDSVAVQLAAVQVATPLKTTRL